jgi:membrane-bound metal-dependent hydrolase YbcI (DUF457 family)
MMGSGHSSSGLFTGAALLPWAPILPTPAAQAQWVIVCGGMALVNDLDHHSSTVSRMWGVPSRAVAAGVGVCAGGHRNGTHSLLGVAVFTAVAWTAETWFGQWGRMFWIALAVGLALYALTPILPNKVRVPRDVPLIGGHTFHPEQTLLALNIVVSWWAAWWLVSNTPPAATAWLPWAVAVGMLTHIAGDWLTKGGVPLLWPIRWRTALGLFTTGGRFEKAIVAPGFTAAAVLALNHNGLLGVPTLVGWLGGVLESIPALDSQVASWGAPTLAAGLLAGVAAWLAAKDTRAWGAVTA